MTKSHCPHPGPSLRLWSLSGPWGQHTPPGRGAPRLHPQPPNTQVVCLPAVPVLYVPHRLLQHLRGVGVLHEALHLLRGPCGTPRRNPQKPQVDGGQLLCGCYRDLSFCCGGWIVGAGQGGAGRARQRRAGPSAILMGCVASEKPLTSRSFGLFTSSTEENDLAWAT